MVLGWCGDPFFLPALCSFCFCSVSPKRPPLSVKHAPTDSSAEWPLGWALIFLPWLGLCTPSALVFITTYRNTKEQRSVRMKTRSVNLLWLCKMPGVLQGVWKCNSHKLSCTVASLLHSFSLACRKSIKSWNQE